MIKLIHHQNPLSKSSYINRRGMKIFSVSFLPSYRAAHTHI